MEPIREPARETTILPAPPAAEERVGSTPARAGEPARAVAVLGVGRKIVVAGTRDARVATIAAQQRGRIARRQLLASGLTAGQVDHLLRAGRLFRQLGGVYAVGSPAPVALGRETTALLAAREGALLSHASAARLWGLLPDPPDADTSPVHVTIDDGWIPRIPGIHGHRSRILAAEDRRVRERLPVLSPARTLLDLAPELDQRSLGRIIDEWQLREIVRPREIAELLVRAGGHRGVAPLRALLADAEVDAGVTESEAEQLLRSLLHQTDLPHPRRQLWVEGYRLDCYWPDGRLAVEIDGYRYHSTRRRFEADRVRDARLAAAGIEVLRITWRQMVREPLAVVARIAAALARRTPTPTPP
jgi:very-short-patch-repair endonuclease